MSTIRKLVLNPILLLATACSACMGLGLSYAEEWIIPLAGNAYLTAPGPGERGIQGNRSIVWSEPANVYAVYFHVDRPAVIDLGIRARVPQGRSTLVVRGGERVFEVTADATQSAALPVGRIDVSHAGYIRIEIQGVKRTGEVFAEVQSMIVASESEDLSLDFVTSNDGNMFYWGRRGPSVHLRYDVPEEATLQYAYSEVLVPEGKDPIGTFSMANGFGQGYFGIQVNGASERRVLFSVWSPFNTDNPKDIPEDQRIAMLGKGPEVRVGEFGNEGSGGQSYLVYPWKSGITYRFLTEVRPDGQGNTIYTSWFGEASAETWNLIASFRRPMTDTHLSGFHSFLESFSPSHGYLERRATYGNVWVCDVKGQWHECTRATFSVDATGRSRNRLDFTGGVQDGQFFLRNCGFFDETGRPGESFTRQSTVEKRPEIDFARLPR